MYADPLAETATIDRPLDRPLEWDDNAQPPNDDERKGTACQ